MYAFALAHHIHQERSDEYLPRAYVPLTGTSDGCRRAKQGRADPVSFTHRQAAKPLP